MNLSATFTELLNIHKAHSSFGENEGTCWAHLNFFEQNQTRLFYPIKYLVKVRQERFLFIKMHDTGI